MKIRVAAITRNVVVIGKYLDRKDTEYIRKIFGDNAKITLHSPTAPQFVSREGFQQFLERKDETVIVLGNNISEKSMSYARENGLTFVQLRRDVHRDNVTGHWNNVLPDQQILDVSTQEEIDALKTGKTLATA